MNSENENRATAPYRPELTLYHANARGTGCAASMNLHPAHDRKSGCIMMRLANQMTVGDRRGANPTFPRFDWESAITVKLGFDDLCKILQVFRGECETIEDGKGLYHASSDATTKILLRHVLEPVAGYSLEVYRTGRRDGAESRAHIHLTPTEAIGICESIAGSMSVICFGLPMVISREAASGDAARKETSREEAA